MPLGYFPRTPPSYVVILVIILNHFTVLTPAYADPASFAPSIPTSLGSCSNFRCPMMSHESSWGVYGTLLSSYKYSLNILFWFRQLHWTYRMDGTPSLV
ncbi:hypothetical protein C8R44DRAFT_888815 [Mycena epipterygia]|nr:hypothetical protein C8R44DRAFT_888815 [Mycena epipterygia]